eukprot:3539851-Amphidinium_carterae.1
MQQLSDPTRVRLSQISLASSSSLDESPILLGRGCRSFLPQRPPQGVTSDYVKGEGVLSSTKVIRLALNSVQYEEMFLGLGL